MHVTLICADDETWAIGLRSISAALKQAGHSTNIILTCSSNRDPGTRALANIGTFATKSDIIGISSMSRNSKRAKALIATLKPLGKPIVWGGMHPTLYPEDCVGHADLVCRGEGEEFMVDLATRLSRGEEYLDIPNGGYARNGQSVLNDVRPLITDLDKLPFVDFSFSDEFRLDIDGKLRPNIAMKEEGSILFPGSRGCAFNCHYCSNAQVKALYESTGRFVRKMSIAKFVESVKKCREIFPRIKYFYFTDEDFFARPIHEFREFAELYPKEVGLPFECMASPQQISEQKMELLVKAGLWRVDIGVESGSDRVKKEVFNRLGSNEVVLKAAAAIRNYPQVITYYFFIIGNPYEGREDLLGTINLIRHLPYPAFIRTYNLVFLPGTHLFERARKDGIVDGMSDSGFDLDFLAGFDYRNHDWKKNNLYLNGLISLMTAKATRHRTGFIPRAILPMLIRPGWIDFNDRHHTLSKTMIALARGGVKLRRNAMVLVSRILKDPSSAYNVRGLMKKLLKGNVGQNST